MLLTRSSRRRASTPNQPSGGETMSFAKRVGNKGNEPAPSADLPPEKSAWSHTEGVDIRPYKALLLTAYRHAFEQKDEAAMATCDRVLRAMVRIGTMRTIIAENGGMGTKNIAVKIAAKMDFSDAALYKFLGTIG